MYYRNLRFFEYKNKRVRDGKNTGIMINHIGLAQRPREIINTFKNPYGVIMGTSDRAKWELWDVDRPEYRIMLERRSEIRPIPPTNSFERFYRSYLLPKPSQNFDNLVPNLRKWTQSRGWPRQVVNEVGGVAVFNQGRQYSRSELIKTTQSIYRVVTKRNGYICSGNVYSNFHTFNSLDLKKGDPYKLGKLWRLCSILYKYLIPNRVHSVCHVTVFLKFGKLSMENGEVMNFAGTERIKDKYRTASIPLRITYNPDIASAMCLYLARKINDKFDEIVENYGDVLENVFTDDRNQIPLAFLSYVFTFGQNVGLRYIRSGSINDYIRILNDYKNSNIWLYNQYYLRIKNLCTQKNWCIISPKTTKRCVFYCLQMGLEQVNYNDITNKTKKENFRARIQRLVGQCKKDLNKDEPLFIKIIKWFCKKNRGIKVNVFGFHGSCIKQVLKRIKKRKRVKRKINEINLLIGRGHCFIFLDKKLKKEKKDQFPVNQNSLIEKPKPKSDSLANNYIFDIETTFKTNKAYMVGIFNNESMKEPKIFTGFDCMKKFIFYIVNLEKLTKNNFWAHFGGGFDFTYFLDELIKLNDKEYDYKVKDVIEINGIIVKAVIEIRDLKNRKPVYITLRDSYPLLNSSLDRLCKDFKPPFPKLTGTVIYDKVLDSNWEEMNKKFQIEKYLKHDLLSLEWILRKFREKFKKEFTFDPIKCYTISSVSKHFFFNRFYKPSKWPIYYLKKDIDKQLREFYCGGRTECFYFGNYKHKVRYYDMNSMYPTVMRGLMPYGEPIWRDKITDILKFNGFVKVKITGGYKKKKNLHAYKVPGCGLCFPYFKSPKIIFLWSEEIQYSIRHKLPYKYEFLGGFEFKVDYIFKDLINYLYEIKKQARKDNNGSMYHISKLLINCAYGYWGLRIYDVLKLIILTESPNNPDPVRAYLEKGNLISSEKKGKLHMLRIKDFLDSKHVNIPIASAVTSKARIVLFDTMRKVESKLGGNVLYCDTDSIICDKKIEWSCLQKEIMGKGTELGQWKNELGTNVSAKSLVLVAPKIYAFEDRQPLLKMKGFYKRLHFEKKVYDEEKKIISFINPRSNKFKDEKKVEFKDLILICKGWTLKQKVFRTIGKTRSYLKNDMKIVHEELEIDFKADYKKGIVQPNNFIFPLQI